MTLTIERGVGLDSIDVHLVYVLNMGCWLAVVVDGEWAPHATSDLPSFKGEGPTMEQAVANLVEQL